MTNRWENNGNNDRSYFSWAPKSLQMVTAAMKLRVLLLQRKTMTNLDSVLKSRDITLLTKVSIVKAMVFPVIMYGCESCTIKSAKELMLLNCAGEDSWESFGEQGDQTSQSPGKSFLNMHWCWICIDAMMTDAEAEVPIYTVNQEVCNLDCWGYGSRTSDSSRWLHQVACEDLPGAGVLWGSKKRRQPACVQEALAWFPWLPGCAGSWTVLFGFPGRVEFSSVIHSLLLLSEKPSIGGKKRVEFWNTFHLWQRKAFTFHLKL